MRLHLGPVPDDPTFAPEAEGWLRLREPSFGLLLLAALPTGLLLAAGTLVAWVGVIQVRALDPQIGGVITPASLLWVVVAIAAMLVAHELLHALALPGAGLTSATVLGFWPQALTPYVSHEGELSRTRHIVVGLTPLLALSLAPMLVGLACGVAPAWAIALTVLNALGAAGDVIGTVLALIQVPADGVVRSQGRETWWRPA